MNITRFHFGILMAVLVLAAGCIHPIGKSPLNQAEGWNFLRSQDPAHLDAAIRDDYRDYIQKLPKKQKNAATLINLFADGKGRHAVTIELGLDGTNWTHVLIYDKENNRVKVVKYVSGHYQG